MSPRDSKLKFGDKEIGVPRWALNALWATLILGLIGYGIWWVSDHMNKDLPSISPAEKLQMDMATAHFGQKPAREFTAYADDRGELRVMEFTDGVASMVRRIGSGPVQVAWLTVPGNGGSFPVASLEGDWGLASPAYAQQSYCNAPFPHPWQVGQPVDRRIDGCVIERIWSFSDGCQVGQYYDACANVWQLYPSGYPVLRWWTCNHY